MTDASTFVIALLAFVLGACSALIAVILGAADHLELDGED